MKRWDGKRIVIVGVLWLVSGGGFMHGCDPAREPSLNMTAGSASDDGVLLIPLENGYLADYKENLEGVDYPARLITRFVFDLRVLKDAYQYHVDNRGRHDHLWVMRQLGWDGRSLPNSPYISSYFWASYVFSEVAKTAELQGEPQWIECWESPRDPAVFFCRAEIVEGKLIRKSISEQTMSQLQKWMFLYFEPDGKAVNPFGDHYTIWPTDKPIDDVWNYDLTPTTMEAFMKQSTESAKAVWANRPIDVVVGGPDKRQLLSPGIGIVMRRRHPDRGGIVRPRDEFGAMLALLIIPSKKTFVIDFYLCFHFEEQHESRCASSRERSVPVDTDGTVTESLPRQAGRLPGRETVTQPDTPKTEPDTPKTLTLNLGNNVTMELVKIPAGTFTMGSPDGETPRGSDEGPQREVTISKPFYMGVYEVTQAQYEAVTGKAPWKGGIWAKENPEHAASHISWDDATAFCKAISKKTGKTVRLPTEAEWEYACRAGSTTRFSYGDDNDYSKLGDYAWYQGNAWDKSEKYAHPVGRKKPNAWGLYDMHGNVWELCNDWHQDSYKGLATKDPKGPNTGSDRVHRGGSWFNAPSNCRSAMRSWGTPGVPIINSGFRVAVNLK